MTYRNRLIFYVVLLVILLVGMMTLSFKAARDVIISNAEDQLRLAALLEQDSLHNERTLLLRNADRIAADSAVRQVLLGHAGPAASAALSSASLEAQFSAFTSYFYQLSAADGTPLLSQGADGVAEHISESAHAAERGLEYLVAEQGLVMIARAPVIDAGRRSGTVVVGRYLDRAWLQQRAGISADYLLFFSHGDRVLFGNHAVADQHRVDISNRMLVSAGQQFRLREVALDGAPRTLPRLWLGIAETRLFGDLPRYAQWVYLFTVLGGAAVLLVGWLILRNFQRPFAQLMSTTQELLDGKLPVVARSIASTEMDQLVNRFADVLDALRREQRELKAEHEKLQHTAITDSLTRLYNRRYLLEVAPGLFAQVERDQRYLTATILDLDHFKEINDCHGHLGGDAVLVHFSRLLKHNSRANDHLFRIGGEEFLILNVAEDPEDSVVVANKIRELVEASAAKYQGLEIPITVSAGISCCYGSAGNSSLSQLLRGADKALYEAKAGGRNRVILHSSCQSAAVVAKQHGGMRLVTGKSS